MVQQISTECIRVEDNIICTKTLDSYKGSDLEFFFSCVLTIEHCKTIRIKTEREGERERKKSFNCMFYL